MRWMVNPGAYNNLSRQEAKENRKLKMDNNGATIDKKPSVVNLEPFNMSSTLKLTAEDRKGEKPGKLDPDLYDPFSNRDMTHATPDSGALLHLLKSSLGSGILAMPNAFKNGGLGFGIIGTIVVGIICTHCVQMLLTVLLCSLLGFLFTLEAKLCNSRSKQRRTVRRKTKVYCSQILSGRVKKPSLGFPETAEVAFQTGPQKYKQWATLAREFVNGALFATYYFGNTVYVVFVATSFKQVIDNNAGIDWNIRFYILILALPLIPLGIIRPLKYLVPFSALATAFIMFGLGVTLYYTFSDLPPITSRPMFSSFPQLPLFFSTVIFAMEGIGTVLPIENSMKNPHHFLGCPGVLSTAMTVVVILYTSVGFFGYLKFGADTQASITLNLEQSVLAQSVKILVALSILFTYGLQFSVPSEIVWKRLSPMVSENKQTVGYYTMRALMILGTVGVGVAVPDLGPIISLVGAICFSILGLFCPAIIEIMTYWDEPEAYGLFRWRLIKNIILALLAILALVSGTYASLLEILEHYSSPHV